ncbi:hypothetical protein BCR34DRAFT_605119 [Clohesyomyces aquaticus]|uniref:Uncharacterized protein n=1 Tax=Clohesyomyces aquaticus TaxID=1231657 RepID=A0A1Y1Z0A8_9PLEO|nr:hypothetical protein BCR34DRAFT_605119 [Clohesyomyces aquaticus]
MPDQQDQPCWSGIQLAATFGSNHFQRGQQATRRLIDAEALYEQAREEPAELGLDVAIPYAESADGSELDNEVTLDFPISKLDNQCVQKWINGVDKCAEDKCAGDDEGREAKRKRDENLEEEDTVGPKELECQNKRQMKRRRLKAVNSSAGSDEPPWFADTSPVLSECCGNGEAHITQGSHKVPVQLEENLATINKDTCNQGRSEQESDSGHHVVEDDLISISESLVAEG